MSEKTQSEAIPYSKIGELILRNGVTTASACSETMERYFILKPHFGALVLDTMAFCMSTALHELMRREKKSTKEDYEEFERELGKAVVERGVQIPDQFLFAVMPTDEFFGMVTLYYYKASLEGFGISVNELEQFARKFGFLVPNEPGWALAVLIHYVSVIRLVGIEQIASPEVQSLAVMGIKKILGNNVEGFVEELRDTISSA